MKPNVKHKRLNIKVEGLWSAMEICDAWALKRGFLTAKAGRPGTPYLTLLIVVKMQTSPLFIYATFSVEPKY